jgi:transcriptional regulator GlxA family with amidase domain
MPAGKVEREEDARDRHQSQLAAAVAEQRLAIPPREQGQQRQRQEQAPEAGGNRPRIRHAHEQRPQRQAMLPSSSAA